MTPIRASLLIRRRGLLLGAASSSASTIASSLGMPFISRGHAAGSIKIGVSVAKGGPLGSTESGVRHAAELAVKKMNGKVLDQPIELVPIEETSVAETDANAKKAIEQNKIVGLIGGSESSRALALQKIALNAKLPLIVHTSMLDDITGKNCNRWVFRVPAPYGVQYKAMAGYLTGYGKKWFTVGVDGTSGPYMLRLARSTMMDAGAQEVGTITIPQATTDFSEVIAKIKAANPDAIVGALYGSSIPLFLKALKTAGMKDKIPFTQVGLTDGDAWEAGADAISGIYAKTWHFASPQNSKEDREFVKDYQEAFKGSPPSTTSWQAFVAMRSLLSSIERAEAPDPDKIRVALERFRRPSGDVVQGYRDFDHQMLNRVAVLETKAEPTGAYDWWDVEASFPAKATDLDAFYGIKEQNVCTFSMT